MVHWVSPKRLIVFLFTWLQYFLKTYGFPDEGVGGHTAWTPKGTPRLLVPHIGKESIQNIDHRTHGYLSIKLVLKAWCTIHTFITEAQKFRYSLANNWICLLDLVENRLHMKRRWKYKIWSLTDSRCQKQWISSNVYSLCKWLHICCISLLPLVTD